MCEHKIRKTYSDMTEFIIMTTSNRVRLCALKSTSKTQSAATTKTVATNSLTHIYKNFIKIVHKHTAVPLQNRSENRKERTVKPERIFIIIFTFQISIHNTLLINTIFICIKHGYGSLPFQKLPVGLPVFTPDCII